MEKVDFLPHGDDYDKDDEDKNVSKNVAQASHLSSHFYSVLVS